MAARCLAGFGHSHLSAYLSAYSQDRRAGGYEGLKAVFERLNRDELQPNLMTVRAETMEQADKAEAERLANRIAPQAAFASLAGPDHPRALSPQVEAAVAAVLDRERPEAVLLAAMGNEYNAMAMLRHPQPYDFDLPGSGIPADPAAERIEWPLIRTQLEFLAGQNVLLFWRFVRRQTQAPVLVVPPPPPVGSEAHIRSYPGQFGERVREYGVAPAGFRRKMWLAYCGVLRAAAAEIGCRFVELPEVVFEDGFLAPRFWREDPTHGNTDYGRVMLAEVLAAAFGDARTLAA